MIDLRSTRPDANALNQSRVTNRFFLDGVLSWELDLFGRVRRQKESAEAQFFATGDSPSAEPSSAW